MQNTHQLSKHWKCRGCFCWCVFTARCPVPRASPPLMGSSKALQDCVWHPPVRPGTRCHLGGSCWSKRRDCENYFLTGKKSQSVSHSRAEQWGFHHLCWSTHGAGSLCRYPAVVKHACCPTGLGTEPGLSQVHREPTRVPLSDRSDKANSTLLPAPECSWEKKNAKHCKRL